MANIKRKKISKNEKGSVTIEMVFLFPILCFFSFFVVIMGIVIFQKIVVVDAAREAARVYALNFDTINSSYQTDTEQAILKAKQVMASGGLVVGSTTSVASSGPQYDIICAAVPMTDNVTVTIEYTSPSPIPGLGGLINSRGSLNEFFLTHTATFRKETGGTY